MPSNRLGPWFKLWVADFHSDIRVMTMSNAALGIYFRLLCFEWTEGPLPVSHDILAQIGRSSKSEFKKLWPEVEVLFTKTSDGHLVQKRLERERTNAAAQRERQSLGGKMTSDKRWKETE